ncbi:hypothetical protein [Saccharothrix obliqua]|uniref:hypothetical protein n=1 Tax=Saccharothrix obliqua TaxID=2861747 RepID=UPI001C5DBF52|nr:hypothetical protein [Saccharothrix obliqua]MBW4719930.1 hypothetical protein [Saccharothrix obliqua]
MSIGGTVVIPERRGPDSRRQVVVHKLTWWVLFGVLIGILPLFVDGLKALMSPEGLAIEKSLAKGELLISSAAISAAALGELFFVPFPGSGRVFRAFAGFCGILCCMFNSLAYIQVPFSEPSAVVNASIILFCFSVLSSAANVGLAAGR